MTRLRLTVLLVGVLYCTALALVVIADEGSQAKTLEGPKSHHGHFISYPGSAGSLFTGGRCMIPFSIRWRDSCTLCVCNFLRFTYTCTRTCQGPPNTLLTTPSPDPNNPDFTGAVPIP